MSEVTIIDADNGIWAVEPPVRCEALRGRLVFCNEEVIGCVEQTGRQDFLASYLNNGHLRSLAGYLTMETAARAVAVEVLGPMAYEDLITDHDADDCYEQACDTYILVGPS